MLFKDIPLKAGLLRSISDMGYQRATPIQEKVISLALQHKNIVGQSQTGTGKTAAFLIPLLQHVDTNAKGLQALILAPTRELVQQITDEIYGLTKYYRVNAVAVFGGASQVNQKIKLQKNPSIIVATPGRLMDFINQGVINLKTAPFFILDEVDRMLDMGFIRDIRKIRAQLSSVKQTYTFSATMTDDIKKIITEHVPNYEFIKIGEEVTVDKINHSHTLVAHEDKIINVRKLIDLHPHDKIVVFTQTKRNTKTIYEALQRGSYKVGMLNGDMSQGKRTSTLGAFKQGDTKILITTDVAARGLNMDNVGLVINFDVPNEPESYIHRIGRTGRAGAHGKAIMFVSPLEKPLFEKIQNTQKITIKTSDYKSIRDDKRVYSELRLDRSTDKPGARRMGKAARGHNPGRPVRSKHSARGMSPRHESGAKRPHGGGKRAPRRGR